MRGSCTEYSQPGMVYKTKLRKVEGSVMLTIPPALMGVLQLRPGAEVDIAIDSRRLVVAPQHRPRYTLDELLAECRPTARRRKQDREWLDGGPVGAELL
jgi:antitoxin ChpS